MVNGIIMVKIFPGNERRIHRALSDLVGIEKIYLLFGDFDFLLNVQVEGLLTLNGLVETIRGTEGVITTRTILARTFEESGPMSMEAC